MGAVRLSKKRIQYVFPKGKSAVSSIGKNDWRHVLTSKKDIAPELIRPKFLKANIFVPVKALFASRFVLLLPSRKCSSTALQAKTGLLLRPQLNISVFPQPVLVDRSFLAFFIKLIAMNAGISSKSNDYFSSLSLL